MRIKGFPGGEIPRVHTHAGARPKLVPTPKQEQWILEYYGKKAASLRDIAQTVGASHVWVKLFCYAHGVKRDPSIRGIVCKKTKQSKKVTVKTKQKSLSTDIRDIQPDKDLLREMGIKDETVNEPCMGKRCFNYGAWGCCTAKNHPQRVCNALF